MADIQTNRHIEQKSVIKGLDIFQSDAQILVNPVNTDGVPGAGLALAFARKYPKSAREYIKQCQEKKLEIGTVFLDPIGVNKYILYFPTKASVRYNSHISYVQQSLKATKALLQVQKDLKSIAIPMVGCGLGGLKWEDVKPLLLQFAQEVEPHCRVDILETP